jgi:hypothetical protein
MDELEPGITYPPFELESQSLYALQCLARNFNLRGRLTSKQELLHRLSQVIPFQWMEACMIELDTNLDNSINLFIRSYGMSILIALRNGLMISTEEFVFIYHKVNRDILLLPPTPHEFIVFRGFHPRSEPALGETFATPTPVSGSFNIEAVMSGYIDADKHCCIAEIIVPKGVHVGYHRSENQVIFPLWNNFQSRQNTT